MEPDTRECNLLFIYRNDEDLALDEEVLNLDDVAEEIEIGSQFL